MVGGSRCGGISIRPPWNDWLKYLRGSNRVRTRSSDSDLPCGGIDRYAQGFEGLYGLVRDQLGLDPLSGHLFLFCNKGRNRLKVLYWDGSGLWVCAKRLEKGRFSWPSSDEHSARVTLSQEELSLLLSGIDVDCPSSSPGSRGLVRRCPLLRQLPALDTHCETTRYRR